MSFTEVRMAKSVTLCGGGYTERDIGAKLRCSKTAVHNYIVIFAADSTFHDRKRSMHWEYRSMGQTVMRSPTNSCKRLKGTSISSSTDSRRLRI